LKGFVTCESLHPAAELLRKLMNYHAETEISLLGVQMRLNEYRVSLSATVNLLFACQNILILLIFGLDASIA